MRTAQSEVGFTFNCFPMGVYLATNCLHSYNYYCFSGFSCRTGLTELLFMLKERLFFFLKLLLLLFAELHSYLDFNLVSSLPGNHHSKYCEGDQLQYFIFEKKLSLASKNFARHCRSSQVFCFKHSSTAANYLLFKNSSNISSTSYRLCTSRQHLPHILMFCHLFCKIFMSKAKIHCPHLRMKNCSPSFDYLHHLNY